MVLSTLGTRSATKKKPSKTKRALRPDIQGLRALAVLAVIADHLFHWPSGGFVGVDVFFVISGFLITGVLVREYEKTGRISFVDFYRRRIKRILPASVLALAVTLAVSYFVFSKSRFDMVTWDVIWAFFFAGNWRFALAGTDYFQADGPVSPIQHFWSLGVEEQFYFVWPWVMLLIIAMMAKRSSNGTAVRLAVGIAITLISVASFAWAMHETTTTPTLAYFSTFSRAWELGVGAGLAILAPVLVRLPNALRPVLGWVGFLGIIASLFIINSTSIFPAPTAALPVLATGLVILAGTGGPQRFLAPLTNRVSGYVGDISYSLYLWHFPAIILLSSVMDITQPVTAILLLAGIFVISIYAFHLVEDPIRRSSWLDAKTKHRRKQRQPLSQSYKLTALSALMLITALTVAALLAPPAQTPQAVSPVAVAKPTTTAAAPSQTPELDKLQAEISTALTAASWPALTPSMDETIAGGQAPGDVGKCASPDNLVDEPSCTWGNANASKTALLVGDSISATYAATLRETLGSDASWKFVSYATFGCFCAEGPKVDADTKCAARRADAMEAIQRIKPDLLFVSNHYEARSPAGIGKITDSERTEAVASALDKAKLNVGKVVLLAPPPQDVKIEECSKLSKPADCVGTVIPQFDAVRNLERQLAARIGAAYVDTEAFFCSARSCPSFVGTTPTKHDRMHMSIAYQTKIAPALREQLVSLKLL
ncbi:MULTISPECIES: acyltransferase family protein [unclassified Arthrobacter]|uniref:acyltransferase family protein n=1 Tax=unclassified Arthrobacter TaxID=235627 RepID=UPI0015E302F2|nr:MULTISPECIES: acyltransferase family protein [unclassified Arthrobacter]